MVCSRSISVNPGKPKLNYRYTCQQVCFGVRGTVWEMQHARRVRTSCLADLIRIRGLAFVSIFRGLELRCAGLGLRVLAKDPGGL